MKRCCAFIVYSVSLITCFLDFARLACLVHTCSLKLLFAAVLTLFLPDHPSGLWFGLICLIYLLLHPASCLLLDRNTLRWEIEYSVPAINSLSCFWTISVKIKKDLPPTCLQLLQEVTVSSCFSFLISSPYLRELTSMLCCLSHLALLSELVCFVFGLIINLWEKCRTSGHFLISRHMHMNERLKQ